MKLKLHRDKVVSMTDKGDLVGVYVKYHHYLKYLTSPYEGDYTSCSEVLLAEMSPEKADKIIKIWNSNV